MNQLPDAVDVLKRVRSTSQGGETSHLPNASEILSLARSAPQPASQGAVSDGTVEPNWVMQNPPQYSQSPQPVYEVPQTPQEPMWTRSSERPGYYEERMKVQPPDTLPGNRTPAKSPELDYRHELALGAKETKEGQVNYLRETFGDDNLFISEQGKLWVRPDGVDWVEASPSMMPAILKAAAVVGGTVALGPGAAASPVVAAGLGGASELVGQGISAILPGSDELSAGERAADVGIGAGLGYGGQLAANTLARIPHALSPRNIIGKHLVGKEVREPAKEGWFMRNFVTGNLKPNVGPLKAEAQEGIDLAKKTGVPLSVGRATESDFALQTEGWLRRGPGGAVVRASDEAQSEALGTLKRESFDVIGPETTPEAGGTIVQESLEAKAPLSKVNRERFEALRRQRLEDIEAKQSQLVKGVGEGETPLPTAEVGKQSGRTYSAASDKLYKESTAEADALFKEATSLLGEKGLSGARLNASLKGIEKDFSREGRRFAHTILDANRVADLLTIAKKRRGRMLLTPDDLQAMLRRASMTLRGEGFTTNNLTPRAQRSIATRLMTGLQETLEANERIHGIEQLRKARMLWGKAMQAIEESDSLAMDTIDKLTPGETIVTKLYGAPPSDLHKALTRLRIESPQVESQARQELLVRHLEPAYDYATQQISPKKVLGLQARDSMAKLNVLVPPKHRALLTDYFDAAREALPGKKPEPTALDIIYRQYKNLPPEAVVERLAAAKPSRIRKVMLGLESYDKQQAARARRAVVEELFAASSTQQTEASIINRAANDTELKSKLMELLPDGAQREGVHEVMKVARKMANDRYAGSPTEPLTRVTDLLQGIYKNIRTGNVPGLAMTWLNKRTPEELAILFTHTEGPKSILTLTSPSTKTTQAIHAAERLVGILSAPDDTDTED